MKISTPARRGLLASGVVGRSPGLRVDAIAYWLLHLPVQIETPDPCGRGIQLAHSGTLKKPNSSTVAGAAPE